MKAFGIVFLKERNEKKQTTTRVHEREGKTESVRFLGFHKEMGLKTHVLGLAGSPVPLLLKREGW